MKHPSPTHRLLASLLAGLIFLTNTLFAHASEINFWSERRLSSLSTPVLPALSLKNIVARPSAESNPQHELISAIPLTYGTVRHVLSGKPNGPTIVYIQDVHMNQEAQENIGKVVTTLIEKKKIGLIALEGAFTDLNFDRIKTFSDQAALGVVADYLLKTNRITGPMHAAFSAGESLPPVVGVDDPTHYQNNVSAYKISAPHIQTTKSLLKKAEAQLASEKRVFNSHLKTFDTLTHSYHERNISLGEYINSLHQISSTRPYPAIEIFRQAWEAEQKLDLAKVEADRNDLLSLLLPRLTTEESRNFLNTTVAYRMGQIEHKAFYAELQHLCKQTHINIKQFKNLDRYIQYVFLSEKIDGENLFSEMGRLETRIYESLIQTPMERLLVEKSRTLRLQEKLVDFSLNSEEWSEYQKINLPLPTGERSAAETKSQGRERALIPSPSSAKQQADSSLSPAGRGYSLAPFEQFYLEAHSRDEALSGNLIKAMSARHAQTAVLVTGGYHSKGVTQRLAGEGYTVIEFVPKLTKIESGSGSEYLSSFVQKKTPLDKLFEGEKLFVSNPPMNVTLESVGELVAGVQEFRNGPATFKEARETIRHFSGRAVPSEVHTADTQDGADVIFPRGQYHEVLKNGVLISVTFVKNRWSDWKQFLPQAKKWALLSGIAGSLALIAHNQESGFVLSFLGLWAIPSNKPRLYTLDQFKLDINEDRLYKDIVVLIKEFEVEGVFDLTDRLYDLGYTFQSEKDTSFEILRLLEFMEARTEGTVLDEELYELRQMLLGYFIFIPPAVPKNISAKTVNDFFAIMETGLLYKFILLSKLTVISPDHIGKRPLLSKNEIAVQLRIINHTIRFIAGLGLKYTDDFEEIKWKFSNFFEPLPVKIEKKIPSRGLSFREFRDQIIFSEEQIILDALRAKRLKNLDQLRDILKEKNIFRTQPGVNYLIQHVLRGMMKTSEEREPADELVTVAARLFKLLDHSEIEDVDKIKEWIENFGGHLDGDETGEAFSTMTRKKEVREGGRVDSYFIMVKGPRRETAIMSPILAAGIFAPLFILLDKNSMMTGTALANHFAVYSTLTTLTLSLLFFLAHWNNVTVRILSAGHKEFRRLKPDQIKFKHRFRILRSTLFFHFIPSLIPILTLYPMLKMEGSVSLLVMAVGLGAAVVMFFITRWLHEDWNKWTKTGDAPSTMIKPSPINIAKLAKTIRRAYSNAESGNLRYNDIGRIWTISKFRVSRIDGNVQGGLANLDPTEIENLSRFVDQKMIDYRRPDKTTARVAISLSAAWNGILKMFPAKQGPRLMYRIINDRNIALPLKGGSEAQRLKDIALAKMQLRLVPRGRQLMLLVDASDKDFFESSLAEYHALITYISVVGGFIDAQDEMKVNTALEFLDRREMLSSTYLILPYWLHYNFSIVAPALLREVQFIYLTDMLNAIRINGLDIEKLLPLARAIATNA